MPLTDKYQSIDEIIEEWLPKYGLILFKEYKDEAVRAIPVIDNSGDKYEISLSLVENDNIEVVAHGLKEGKQGQTWRIISDKNQLTEDLNRAYSQIDEWIRNKGHNRTWY